MKSFDIKMYPVMEHPIVLEALSYGVNYYDVFLKTFKEWKYIDFISEKIDNEELYIFQKGTRFGLLSYCNELKILLYPDYVKIIPSSNYFFVCTCDFKWGLIKKNTIADIFAEGVLDYSFEEILPFEYEDIRILGNGICAVKNEKGYQFFCLHSKKKLEQIYYRDVRRFSEGLCPVMSDKKLWGYANLLGECVIPCIYKGVRPFRNGIASVRNETDTFNINKYGRTVEYDIVEADIFDDPRHFEPTDIIIFMGNVKEHISNDKYKFIGVFSEGLIAVSTDGYDLGFIDIKGNIVIPFTRRKSCYNFESELPYFTNGIVFVSDCERRTIMDYNGRILFPYYYIDNKELSKEIFYFHDGVHFGHERSNSDNIVPLKSNFIDCSDFYNYVHRYDMSYIIKNDDEIEEEKRRMKSKKKHFYTNDYIDSSWSRYELEEAADIAYEGYSREYLGLD